MRVMRQWLAALPCLLITGASASEGFTRSTLPAVDTDLQSLAWIRSYETFRVNPGTLSQILSSAPMQTPGLKKFAVIGLPTPDGHTAQFKIVESPTMSDALSKRIAVKTYKVVGIDDKHATGRLDWGINGFHGIITSPNGSYTIDPPRVGVKDYVVAYYYRDNFTPKNGFMCLTPSSFGHNERDGHAQRVLVPLAGATMKTTRLAVNANGEYTAFYGGQTQAEAGVVTTVNRLNQVYENEAAIHFNLTYVKAWTDPNTDPFTNGDHNAMIGQNQAELDATVGDANYDIGHVFSTTFGGLAALNSVGRAGIKALGSSGLPEPVGGLFDTWVVSHETGHQWGSPHTFAFCGSSTPGVEPGSGSTILSYAGICAPADNVQSQPDPYFHGFSLVEIQRWRNDARSGGVEAATGNSIPTADAGADFTIPQNTPFKLTGIATDANSDALTYSWEQYDEGADATFRSLPPSASATRFLPKLSTVLSGGTDKWEPAIVTDRTLTMRVTVRDNRAGGGGTAQDEMKLSVSGAPFQVTSPNGAASWNGGSQQTITWNVGGGTATNVNILFSQDGANYGTGGATMLLANTPNDGTQQVTIPQIATTTGRIIVEAVGNIYYSVNSGNLTVTPTQVPILTDFTLASASVVGGFTTQGTVEVDFAGAGAQEVTMSSSNPNATVPATVTIPTGQLSKNFTINTTAVTSEQSTVITAKLRSVTKTRSLQITRDVGPESLTVNPRVIGGSARAIGNIRLTQPAPPGGVVVTVTDNGPELSVNPNVIIASGHQTQNFTVITYAVNASVVRTITATRAGHTATYAVTIVPLAVASFSIAPSGVVGGNNATGTVILGAPAPAAGITVSLVSNSTVVQVPATFTIPEGQTVGTFPVAASTTSVEVMRQVALTYKNQKMTRNLVVLPADISNLTISPKTIKGGTNATATINLNGNAGTGFVVNVSSNGPEVIVPATVNIGYGKKSAMFVVRTTAVTSGRTRIVTISRNGRTRTFAVVVTK